MSNDRLRYLHPLIDRYASEEMADIFSPTHTALIWRDLWIALAEAERELGVEIPESALAEMKEARDALDLGRVAELEAELRHDVMAHVHHLRHDVMAHVHHFGEVAPAARGYIHLGATSAFVADNASLIQQRDALRLVRDRLAVAVSALSEFAREHRDLPTLGYTHFQAAQPTTVGKRACLWLQDFLFDLDQVDAALCDLRLRGARGTTGTEATFQELLGDGERVDELNRRLAEAFGFSGVYDVVGQIYPRKVDQRILGALSGIGSSAARFGTDIRLLQGIGELEEPFGSRQIGSSAMPYKRNPMRSERMCALARHLCTLELEAAWTASVQWLERTLDDSASRRIVLPEAFLSADAVLLIAQNVGSGLVVHSEIIRTRLERELPFLLAESLLIAGVRAGGDRQDLHERIRGHAMAAREGAQADSGPSDFLLRVEEDDQIPLSGERLRELADPSRLTGRATEQVDAFLANRVEPTLKSADASNLVPASLRV
jgi:adenylosuccinate lyase